MLFCASNSVASERVELNQITLVKTKNILTIQWDGVGMKYQVDRKFLDTYGSIKTLEVTEIKMEDAEKYIPTDIIL